jgi:hypothetical protein
MTVFDVYVNDRKLCRAGVGADGVLTAIVNWVKLTGEAEATAREQHAATEEMNLHVGGLRNRTHRQWAHRPLAPGDRVSIDIRSARIADRPRSTKKRSARQDEEMERQYFERLKSKFDPAPHRTAAATRGGGTDQQTRFLNVDLDVWSRFPLDDLVAGLGRSAIALHAGRQGRRHLARFELATASSDPDRLIRRFVSLVSRLPAPARMAWRRAHRRDLNIGIQAERQPHAHAWPLQRRTLQAAASVDAQITLTVYGLVSESPLRPSRR